MSNKSLKGWTVMVFMADRNNLQPYAAVDLAEMAKIGSSEKLKILVQVGASINDSPQRFLVRKSRCEMCPPSSGQGSRLGAAAAKTGNPGVLQDFLNFGLKEYPSAHYLLILWGHFIGIGFGKVGNDALTLPELAETLDWFKQERKGKLDILGGDTCNMSFAEAAYQLRDVVDFMVTSELPTQFAGWPYEQVLGAIADDSGTIGPADLGRAIVERYIDSYKPPPVSLTLLNLSHADDLERVLTDLVEELKRLGTVDQQKHALTIIQAFGNAAHGKVRALIDLLDLCKNLEKHSHDAKLRQVTMTALAALEQNAKKLVAFYKSNAHDAPAMNGLGIFAPFVTTPEDWFTQQITEDNYKGLDLPNETGWGDFVYKLKHVMHGK